MSSVSKLTSDRNQKALLELVQKPGNDVCADCKARNPRWASHNLGIFICVNCATIHRKIGTHITKVKSLTLDSWTKEQLERMKEMGNVNSNAIYNPNELRHPPPPLYTEDERDSELEHYIRAKYEYKRFFDRSALVASKLGPSRSSSSLSARPKSTPATNPPPSSTPSITAPPSSTYVPTTQTRSVSQPMSSLAPSTTTQMPSLQQHQLHPRLQSLPSTNNVTPASAPANGVWQDLVSLQAPSTNSSLPLQYQAPASASFAPSNAFGGMVGPSSAGLTGMSGLSINPTGMSSGMGMPAMGTGMSSYQQAPYSSGMGMPSMVTGMNSYQQAPYSSTPFSQQQQFAPPLSSTFPPSPNMPYGSLPTGLSTSFTPLQQQSLFPNQTQMQSPVTYSSPSLPQMQMSVQSPQPMISPQVMQSQFMPQGHSPQPQQLPMTTTPQLQNQYMTSSPQMQPPAQYGSNGMGMGTFGGQPQPQMFASPGMGAGWGQPPSQGQQQWGTM